MEQRLYSPPTRGKRVRVKLNPGKAAMDLDSNTMRHAGEIAVVDERQLQAIPDLGEVQTLSELAPQDPVIPAASVAEAPHHAKGKGK